MHSLFRRSLSRTLSSHHRRAYHAQVLDSLVSTSSPEFITKATAMDELVKTLETKMATARQGGGTKAAERMRAKGKRLPRERFGNSTISPISPSLNPIVIWQTKPYTWSWVSLSRIVAFGCWGGLSGTKHPRGRYYHRNWPHLWSWMCHCREWCNSQGWIILPAHSKEAP